MPKEITHWTLAEKALSKINNDSVLKKIILKHKNLYLTGAVIMDTPSYVFCSRDSKIMNQLAREIHNQTNNSFKSITRIFCNYSPQVPDDILSLVCGIITHIIVDGSFHPFICYFSGRKLLNEKKRNNQPVIRHRFIEIYIDYYYIKKMSLKTKRLFSKILKNIEMDRKQFLDILLIFFGIKEDINISRIKKALKYHAIGKHLFYKSSLRFILQIINIIPGLDLEFYISLFYPSLKYKTLSIFCNPIEYLHPVTGKKFKLSLDDLEAQTTQEIVEVFQNIESHLNKRSFAKMFSYINVPNLSTGMKNKKKEDMKYFDTDKDLSELIFGSKR